MGREVGVRVGVIDFLRTGENESRKKLNDLECASRKDPRTVELKAGRFAQSGRARKRFEQINAGCGTLPDYSEEKLEVVGKITSP